MMDGNSIITAYIPDVPIAYNRCQYRKVGDLLDEIGCNRWVLAHSFTELLIIIYSKKEKNVQHPGDAFVDTSFKTGLENV